MLELLSPAGSPEAVIAAVQNGADAVYMGMGNFNARRNAKNFTEEEFEKAVRYCRIRGCKTYLTLNTIVSDREMEQALKHAKLAADVGVDALIVQDLGLVSVLRRALPNLELHASTQMSVHNLSGARAIAELGLKRVVLARELSFENIKYISQNLNIETEVFVHGALCFCHSGQCYMSSLIGRRSGNRGMCAQPCRLKYSLGGRMDDYPLSLKDQCLLPHLEELEQAGVACAKIEGRMKRPEYTAIVTKIYSRILKEHVAPTEEEINLLERAFSRQGFTDGYYTGEKKNMNGIRLDNIEVNDKIFTDARKGYAEGEVRRVPVHLYTVCRSGEFIKSIAFDEDGNKVSARGQLPEKATRVGLSDRYIMEQMQKTGGTPYFVTDNKALCDDGLYLPASAINELRRDLLKSLSEARATPPKQPYNGMPPLPAEKPGKGRSHLIFQVTSPDQLTPQLATMKPDYIYFPAMSLLGSYSEKMAPFLENGSVPVAVLPRIITDNQMTDVLAALEGLRNLGVRELLIGNLGQIFIASKMGFVYRGDFGLNVFNSYSLDMLRIFGFSSGTASFECRLNQIADMHKPIDTEMIVYGRLPVMISEQCVISQSAGKCACQKPANMTDRTGNVFPVMKEFGCRNVIYNAHKLYMADHIDELERMGLWGQRMLFTNESPRECVDVVRGYLGELDYKPNMLTRGLYYRGVD